MAARDTAKLNALNNILDKTVYKLDEEGGTLIIPGHGRLCDEWEVTEYRDMVADHSRACAEDDR